MVKMTNEMRDKIFNIGWKAAQDNEEHRPFDYSNAILKVLELTEKPENDDELYIPYIAWSNGYTSYFLVEAAKSFE